MKSVKAVASILMTGVMLLTSGCVQKILGGISGKGIRFQPVNGEPRYAKITCQTNYGTIYDAYVCTPDDTFYDNPLYERG